MIAIETVNIKAVEDHVHALTAEEDTRSIEVTDQSQEKEKEEVIEREEEVDHPEIAIEEIEIGIDTTIVTEIGETEIDMKEIDTTVTEIGITEVIEAQENQEDQLRMRKKI